MSGNGPARYRRGIELAAALGQVDREVASIALDQLRREPEDALSDAVVAFWLDLSDDAVKRLVDLAEDLPELSEGPAVSLRDRLAEMTGRGRAEIDTGAVRELLASLGPAHAPAPLPSVPGFELEGLIGRGAMGSVYLARQLELRREVALKILRPPDAKAAERFLREGRAAAQVQHANVVTCYGVGRSGDLLYLALELVRGGDAESLLREHGRLPERRALGVARDACRGLTAIEAAGLVHRDIKPANILLAEDGGAKIADLGLARFYAGDDRVTKTGSIVGTPVYMAPEQAGADADVDVRADLYGLGATLYHLVTGLAPFSGGLMAVLSAKATGKAPDPEAARPGLSAATCAVIRKAMAHDRAARYRTARDMLVDLDKAIDALTKQVRRRSSRIRSAARRARWRERRPRRFVALGALVLVLALGAGIAGMQGFWRGPARDAPTGPEPPAAGGGNEAAPVVITTLSPLLVPALLKPRPLQLRYSPPLKVETDRTLHHEGTWYTLISRSVAWDAVSLYGQEPMRVPVHVDFHLQGQSNADAKSVFRAEQGFDAKAGFFYEVGVRSEAHEIEGVGELHGFAVWVTALVDRSGKVHGMIRVLNKEKPKDDAELRVLGDEPTPGIAILDRFEVPIAFRPGPLEVWMRIDASQLGIAIVRRGRAIHELVRAWSELPIPITDELDQPLYLWTDMGNWGVARGHGAIHVDIEKRE